MSTDEFLFRLKADNKDLVREMKKGKIEIEGVSKQFDGATQKSGAFTVSLAGLAKGATLAATAISAATTAVVSYATVQGRAVVETEALATMAGLTVEEFKKLSFVMGTVGISGEKFGDIMKDTQEKVGDFIATGGGAFQDFADVMGLTKEEATLLAKEFETMSGDQVLQQMVNRMEAAGKSTQQMSFALEGMASDTTRLIPLLKDGGKLAGELGDRFDSMEIPLSDEEREQFKQLAANVDLAQIALVNFINNAISPFLPAINEAAEGMIKFFNSWTAGLELNEIVDNNALIKQIQSIDTLNMIYEAAQDEQNTLLEQRNRALERGQSAYADKISREIAGLTQVKSLLSEQKKALIEINEVQTVDRAIAETGGETSSTDKPITGAMSNDDIANAKSELEQFKDASRTKIEILEEERDKRIAIAEELYGNTRKFKELEFLAEQEFDSQIRELTATQQQLKLDTLAAENEALFEAKDKGLISEEQYLQKLKELQLQYLPAMYDREALEEKNQEDLEALDELLNNKVISYEAYYQKIGKILERDAKTKEENKNKENWWSESSVKKQMDDGTQLLQSLGNNSKQAHKIKQGLASANVTMTTAENVTEAWPDPFRTAAAIATGLTQLAAINSSTPDGGGTVASAPAIPEATPQQPVQETTITDISDGQSNTQVMQLQFTDDVIDVIATKIGQSKSDGRT
ncbi:hypothetical protein [Alteromonas sp. W364]|uniref:hypothetical protein n=1 Tax=Alteromonas sp. W364 TaxID=3075610 RepID=UPI002885F46B|nr:hypothetical protein [Alteromonas sp. W364]MDT0626881.1 hypothetical protein [Alteromonas sp. W364]